MPYQQAFINRLYIIRWTGAATLEDFESQLREMQQGRARSPDPLVYVAITPEGTPALSSDVRSEATKMLPRVLKYCQSIHNVVEGSGFWASIMRSMFAGMVLTSSLRLKVFVHSTLDEALRPVAEELGTDRPTLERRLRVAGFLE